MYRVDLMNCKHSSSLHQRVQEVQCLWVCNSIDPQDSNRSKVHCLTTSQLHLWGRAEQMYIQNLVEKETPLEDLGVDESIILK